MIYLIDDNQNNLRQQNYNITFLEEGVFDGFIKVIDKLEIGKSLVDFSHLEFLKSADCILLHSTTEDFQDTQGFISGSITNVIKIKDFISMQGKTIPLVLFSNSMGEPDFEANEDLKYIRGIKKNIFYERLYDFLDNYKQTQKIELKIIAIGKNYAAAQNIKLGAEILIALQSKSNADFLQLSDIMSIKSSFEKFIEDALPTSDLEAILKSVKNQTIRVQDFKKNINTILESYTKYGKNIHTWK